MNNNTKNNTILRSLSTANLRQRTSSQASDSSSTSSKVSEGAKKLLRTASSKLLGFGGSRRRSAPPTTHVPEKVSLEKRSMTPQPKKSELFSDEVSFNSPPPLFRKEELPVLKASISEITQLKIKALDSAELNELDKQLLSGLDLVELMNEAFHAGNQEESHIASSKKTLKLFPDSPSGESDKLGDPIRHNLAMDYFYEGIFCEEAFNYLKEIDSGYYAANEVTGLKPLENLFLEGKVKSALSKLSLYMNYIKMNSQARYSSDYVSFMLSFIDVSNGKFTEGVELLDRLNLNFKHINTARAMKGYAYNQLGQHEKAAEVLSKIDNPNEFVKEQISIASSKSLKARELLKSEQE